MSAEDKNVRLPWSFWLQYHIDNCLVLFSYFSVLLMNAVYFRFTVKNIRSLRKEFKEIITQNEGGLLICPNHLTYLDSLVIQFSLASAWSYFLRPSTYAWNLPKKTNVIKSRFFRVMCYLGKCILLPDRQEPEAIKASMQKIQFLLQKKQYILLFPEGTRSHTGRVDDRNCTYGPGELLQNVPGTKVLCVYQRGNHQEQKSQFPICGENFELSLKLIEPTTQEKGLRGSRDLSRQIMKTLVDMEQEYFSTRA